MGAWLAPAREVAEYWLARRRELGLQDAFVKAFGSGENAENKCDV